MSGEDLFVVYEYTDKAGGLAGNRYFSMYDPKLFKQTFDSEDGITSRDGREKVLAKGIPLSDAERLASNVPLSTRVEGAFQMSTDSKGRMNPRRLEMHTKNVFGTHASRTQ